MEALKTRHLLNARQTTCAALLPRAPRKSMKPISPAKREALAALSAAARRVLALERHETKRRARQQKEALRAKQR